jgi:hypothetical protein
LSDKLIKPTLFENSASWFSAEHQGLGRPSPFGKPLDFRVLHIFMPFFEEGRAYCFAAVGPSVHQQFPFIFFALVAHIEMKFVYRFIVRISRSSSVLGTIEPFLSVMALGLQNNYNNVQFPFIFFALDAHIEMKFGIQIYHENI